VKTIDLRSDTVTQPTPAMRAAMAEAPVGDDVYGEDPTVNRLQEAAAARIEKEAALFVPSGTMANQIALRALTRPGNVVLASENAHLLVYVAPPDAHFAQTRVVALENTHNRAGGRVFPLALAKDVATAAREAGLAVHLDGARLFNAEVATGTPASAWAELCDTVSFCFSKGLGAPVGSVVCSSRALVGELHRARKLLGGGMRQAGILAAAGLHALEHHVERLADDHANAQRLALGLEQLGYALPTRPETNIVVFEVPRPDAFRAGIAAAGVLINPIQPGVFRAVTHLDVTESDIDETLERIAGCRGASS
jgi:threonine aldolase